MRPVNSKSLFAFLCMQMEKLDNKEIDVQTANSQAGLAKQAKEMLMYEIKRAEVLSKLSEHNKEYSDNIKLREIESKGFDDTTNIKDNYDL